MRNRNIQVLTIGLCLSFGHMGRAMEPVLCSKTQSANVAAANRIETPAYLRVEGQVQLPEAYYESLRQEMKTWVDESHSGPKFQKWIFENRSFDPSHRYADGKSLLELAARADESGMLFRRILKSGLNPYAKEANGKNILIELLEQQNDPALKGVIISLLRGGRQALLPEFNESATQKNDFWSLYEVDRYLRKLRPEDFLVRDQQGRVAVNWIEKLNPLFKDILIEAAFTQQNQEMIEFIMGPSNIRKFENRRGLPFLQLALLSRKADKPETLKNADAIVRMLIEKFNIDPNEPLRYAGRGDGVRLNPPLNAMIGFRVDPQIIELMLAHGANPSAVDPDGMNAMNWAVYVRSQKKDGRYVEILKQHGVQMPSIVNQIWQKKPSRP